MGTYYTYMILLVAMENVVFGVVGIKMYSIHTTIDDVEIIKTINEHTHECEAANIERNVAVNRIERRAAEAIESTSSVINEYLVRLSEAFKVKVIFITL